MRANKSMKNILKRSLLSKSLNSSLKAISDRGFVHVEGCHVLDGLLAKTHTTRSKFVDRTGYECFVNSIHVEDYEPENPISQAVLFVLEVFRVWDAERISTPLTAIVSVDEFSVVTKFHTKREGEQWLSKNIDGYEDPVLTIDSNEDAASLLIQSN